MVAIKEVSGQSPEDKKSGGVAAVAEGVVGVVKAVVGAEEDPKPRILKKPVVPSWLERMLKRTEKQAGAEETAAAVKNLRKVQKKPLENLFKIEDLIDTQPPHKIEYQDIKPVVELADYVRSVEDAPLMQGMTKERAQAIKNINLGRQMEPKGNPVLVETMARLAAVEPRLQNDPDFLLYEAVRLRRFTKFADLSPEVLEETHAFLSGLTEKVLKMKQLDMLPVTGLPIEGRAWSPQELIKLAEANEIRTLIFPEGRVGALPTPGGVSNELEKAVKDLYIGSADVVKDSKLVKAVSGYQELAQRTGQASEEMVKKLISQTEERFLDDPGVRSEAEEVLKRFRKVREVLSVRAQEASVRQGFSVTEDHLLAWGVISKKTGRDAFSVRYLNRDQVRTIFRRPDAQNDDGAMEHYSKEAHKIYTMGKVPGRPDLPEQYEFKEFEELMEWGFGEEGAHRVQTLKNLWDTESRRNGLIANISGSGGDAKKMIEGFQYLAPSDVHHEQAIYTWSNYADSFYEQSLFDLGQNLRRNYQEKLDYLRELVPNDFDRGKMIRRDKYLEVLQAKVKSGALSTDQQLLMNEIVDAKNIATDGVIIQDKHMLHNAEIYGRLSQLQAAYDHFKILQDKGVLTSDQVTKMNEIASEIRRRWKDYTLNSHEYRGPEHRDDLNRFGGLSPVEIEAYIRLEQKLKSEGITELPEWKMRNAILSARRTFIGSGRAVTAAAKLAILPGLEYSVGGRHVMPTGWAEQLLRAENLELFMYRFSMGGKMGDVSRSLLDALLLEREGFTLEEGDQYLLPKLSEGEVREVRKVRTLLKLAEERSGIPFTEMLRKNILGTGFLYDGTTWRMDIAIMDPIRQKIQRLKTENKLGPNDVLDNLALGIQLALTGEHDVEGRRAILNRMLERTPSKFFQILGKDLDQMLARHGMRIGSEEWQTFQRALSLAEVRMWDDDKLRLARLDLAKKDDFDLVFNRILPTMKIEPAMGEKYRAVIGDLQKMVREGKRSNGQTMLDDWSRRGFHITMSLADFDWKDTRFDFLGNYTNTRRMVNDQLPKLEAMGMVMNLLTNSEVLSPKDPTKTTIPELKKLRDKINQWQTTSFAEEAEGLLFDVIIDFNFNRAIRTPIGWMPGGVTLLRKLAELDLSGLKKTKHNKLMNKLTSGGWEHWAGHKLQELPHNFGDAVSHSVRFLGEEGRGWDEFYVEFLLREAQDNGNFTDRPDIIHKLRKKYKTGWLPRIPATFRKYWWVIPVATIALALLQATEEEKKKSG